MSDVVLSPQYILFYFSSCLLSSQLSSKDYKKMAPVSYVLDDAIIAFCFFKFRELDWKNNNICFRLKTLPNSQKRKLYLSNLRVTLSVSNQ